MRRVHAFAGLAGFVLVIFMAATGFVLSLRPLLDAATTAPAAAALNVADVAAQAAAHVPGIERLTRSAAGQLVAYGHDGAARTAQIIDPNTGASIGPYAPSPVFSFFTELHRSLFLGGMGHVASGIASLAILVLALSGVFLLVRKMGGWRQLLRRSRGTGAQRLHTTLARAAVLALLLTAATGAYMSAVYFELTPSGETEFAFAPAGAGTTPAPVASLAGLRSIALSDLHELVYPASGDAGDVFTITARSGQGYVDQATGAIIAFTPNSAWQQVYELIYTLHTGDGAWMMAVVLGAGALAVLALAVTGAVIWWSRRASIPRIRNNTPARDADTVILVGSESGSTWHFAASLHEALKAAGCRVHVAAMNDLARAYPKADRLLVLAATYGDGAAPGSARTFLTRLEAFASRPRFAVLGFGDRSFVHFSAYASEVHAAMAAQGLESLLPVHHVDRQSAVDFAGWGRLLGEQIGVPLELTYTPPRRATVNLVLVEREIFGVEVQAPVVRLRFSTPAPGGLFGWLSRARQPRFEPGDLVGILPPGSDVPRYYSLASSTRDGVIEICVRKQAGGLCSQYLHAMMPGDAVKAFVRRNPDFRPDRSHRPLILIGAGAGVAPLAGFVRRSGRRPVYLFFGARHPQSDFLYREEFNDALSAGRLTSLTTAFSRVLGGGYVQDRLRAESTTIRELVRGGAQIMVCGGREMAEGVREAVDFCLAPLGLTVATLKRRGLYLEDAY